uniref:Uncharacterized protein n=1 Tax=Octopus bimaculoides TaxID=37653 RepID=A0A0L8G5Z9_OCTBM
MCQCGSCIDFLSDIPGFHLIKTLLDITQEAFSDSLRIMILMMNETNEELKQLRENQPKQRNKYNKMWSLEEETCSQG